MIFLVADPRGGGGIEELLADSADLRSAGKHSKYFSRCGIILRALALPADLRAMGWRAVGGMVLEDGALLLWG